jgi:exopolyphosphatase
MTLSPIRNSSCNSGGHWAPPPASPFCNYLHSIHSLLQAYSPRLHVVVGNEAADLDSIVGAIGRAFFLNQTSGYPAVPLIDISRYDFRLRRDAELLFNFLEIDAAQLLFREFISLEGLGSQGRLRLHLVDHNILAPARRSLAPFVASILDHHADEKIDYPLCNEKVLETVGSATTLVAEQLSAELLEPTLAVLLLSAIILDTSNLKSGRTTNRDEAAALALTKVAGDKIPSKFYERILGARLDLSGFTPQMILERDMKHYQESSTPYTISSIPYMKKGKKKLYRALPALAGRERVPIAIAMVGKPKGSGRDEDDHDRRVAIYCESRVLLERVVDHLEKIDNGLKLRTVHRRWRYAIYRLSNPMSRKVFQPTLNLGSVSV